MNVQKPTPDNIYLKQIDRLNQELIEEKGKVKQLQAELLASGQELEDVNKLKQTVNSTDTVEKKNPTDEQL